MTDTVDLQGPTCRSCGSIKRTKYHSTRVLENTKVGGKFYERIEFRRCACEDCGQHRVERVFYETSAERERELEKAKPETVSSEVCTRENSSAKRSKRSTRKSQRASKPSPSTEQARR